MKIKRWFGAIAKENQVSIPEPISEDGFRFYVEICRSEGAVSEELIFSTVITYPDHKEYWALREIKL